MKVNPLCLPESEGGGEVVKPLVLRYVGLDGVSHEMSVRAYAGCELGDQDLVDTWQWSANTRDDMEKMGLADAFDDHMEDEASSAGEPPPLEEVGKILAKVPVEVLQSERSREEWALLLDKASGVVMPISEIRPAVVKVIDDVTPYAVVVVVIHKGLVLLSGFTSDTSFDGMLPGGKLEPGETPHQAAIREFYEECGANPVSISSQPLFAAETHDGRPMWVFLGVASERDFPMNDWQYVAGEGYVRWVPLKHVLDYYRPQLRDAAKKIFSRIQQEVVK